MFGLFTRPARKTAPATTRFVRPTLESLEARDCPSTISSAISLSITGYAANKTVTAGGKVTNTPTPGGLTVQLNLGGQAWCSTTTDANGNWSISAPAPSLGTITATTTDGQSNTAQAALAAQAPVLAVLNFVAQGNHWVTISGHVNDNNYQGEVVQFSGYVHTLNGQTAPVNSNGDFSLLAQLDGKPDDVGTLFAKAVDWYGLTSNYAQTDVPPC
jgi:hypothetical protein